MSASPIEHPAVEFLVDEPLLPAHVLALTARNASAETTDSLREAIMEYRAFAISHLREKTKERKAIDDNFIREVLDTAWQIFVPRFQRATGPMIADAYIRAFQNASDGKVPIRLVYQLADEHADRIGKYFNDTSADALAQGFNTYVNRKVPEKAALERVLDAYGMTPRQMSGFTSATALQPQEIKSGVAQNLKAKIKRYIGASISQRLKIFTGQEEHNLDEQAKQVAWMWLFEQGEIAPNAQKMWLTAKDERVCQYCGPLHGRKVGLKEQFTLSNGMRVYVPGAHVNCRCTVRMIEVPLELIGKASDFEEHEHPRARDGRFTNKPKRGPTAAERVVDPALERLAAEARALSAQERREKLEQQIKELRIAPEEMQLKLPEKGQMNLSVPGKMRLGGEMRLNLPDQQMKLKGDQPDLELSPARVELKHRHLELNPAQQQMMQLQLGKELEKLERKVAPVRAKMREYFRNTVKFGDNKAAFGFADMHDVDFTTDDKAPHGRIYISEDTPMRAMHKRELENKIFEAALEKYTEKQYEVVNALSEWGEDYGYVKKWDPTFGQLTAKIDQHDILAAVDAAVNRDSAWAHKKDAIRVTWRDAKGNPIYEGDDLQSHLAPIELADLLEVDPYDLEVVMVQLEEGDEDSWMDTAETKSGEEAWYTPGNYKIMGEQRAVLREGPYSSSSEVKIPIRIIMAEPEVESQFWVQREMTDEEYKREYGQGGDD